MNLCYTARAASDLRDIADYIEQDNPDAAATVIQRIEAAANHLATFPHMGRASYHQGLYQLYVPGLPFAIVYKLTETEVVILTVFHTSRDRESYLKTLK